MPVRPFLVGILAVLWVASWAVLTYGYSRVLERTDPVHRREVLVGSLVFSAIWPLPLLLAKRLFGETEATYWNVALQFAWFPLGAVSAWLWVTVRERWRHGRDRE